MVVESDVESVTSSGFNSASSFAVLLMKTRFEVDGSSSFAFAKSTVLAGAKSFACSCSKLTWPNSPGSLAAGLEIKSPASWFNFLAEFKSVFEKLVFEESIPGRSCLATLNGKPLSDLAFVATKSCDRSREGAIAGAGVVWASNTRLGLSGGAATVNLGVCSFGLKMFGGLATDAILG